MKPLALIAAFTLATLVACDNMNTPKTGDQPKAAAPEAKVALPSDPTLTHRYSFTASAGDSAGNIHGVLKGNAKVEGGKLVLAGGDMGSGDANVPYLEFPQPIIPSSGSTSIVFWFTANNVGGFARIIDFGDRDGTSGRAFIYFTPAITDGSTRAAISATDTASKTFIDTTRIDDNKPHMVAIVINGTTKKFHLFIDGKEPAAAEDLGANTLDTVKPTHSWVGRSGFDQDPGITATVDELRIYNRPLTLAEAAALAAAGPDKLR